MVQQWLVSLALNGLLFLTLLYLIAFTTNKSVKILNWVLAVCLVMLAVGTFPIDSAVIIFTR